MAPALLRDPRLRAVEWRDLLDLSGRDVARELTLSLPWLAAALALAHAGLWPLALPASFVFFLCGLRLVHDAFHYALGISRLGHELVMLALSGLMLGSMHAVQLNHLRHHRFCLAEEDVEGACAKLSAWQAILLGPRFPIRLHRVALRTGSARVRRWVAVELALTLAVVALASLSGIAALQYHVAVMATGQCLTAFFAVWTVHHGCDGSHIIARTIRGRLRAALTYGMFFHVEHHLFPGVPTRRLASLASRIDCALPELATHRVF